MRTVLLVFLTLATLAACNKTDAPAAPGGKSDLVTKLDGFADQACACKDLACADAVAAKLDDFAKATTHVDDADMAPAQAAQGRFDTCHASKNPVLADYTKLTDEICACPDKACGDKVAAKVSKWASDLKASKQKLRQGDVGVFTQIGQKGTPCFQKLGIAIPQ